MLRFRITTVSLLLSFSSAACGGDDRPMITDPVELDELGAALADTFCDKVAMCLGTLSGLLGLTDCNAQFTAQIEDGTIPVIRDAIARGTVTYDAALVRDCLNTAAATSCDVIANLSLDICDDAIAGTVSEGGACSASVECQGDMFCAMMGACPGTCTQRAAGGASCFSNEECVAGLRCDGGTCAEPARLGAACGGASNPECEAGLLCAGEDGDTPGICRAIAEILTQGAGQTCNPMDFQLCRDGLYCAVMGTMTAPTFSCVSQASMGGACSIAFPDMCPSGQYCQVAAMTVSGTCVTLPGEGAPCAATLFGEGCRPGLACRMDVCVRTARIGEACTDGSGCYSGQCSGTTCVEPMLCALP